MNNTNEKLEVRSDYKAVGDSLYTLIPLDEFKALIGVDDREDRLCRFCLVTASLSIEEYCKRKFLRKNYFEVFRWTGHLLLILKEYPVNEIVQVRSEYEPSVRLEVRNDTLIDPIYYRAYPGCAYGEELPFELLLSASLKPYNFSAIKVSYVAGYNPCDVPSDLSAACLELASWNMNRYRGRRVGMSGNIRGAGVQGEHFEMSMPENVRCLIEPYKRKTI